MGKLKNLSIYKGIFLVSLLFLILPLLGQSEEEKEILEERKIANETNSDDRVLVDEKDALKLFNNTPSFGVFHDNFFLTGVPTNKSINKRTADAKFQISIRQRITKSILPFNTFLYLTYTQKAYWDIYKKSSPFLDNNFNPGLSLAKPIIINNELQALGVFSFEHESNGRDSIQSRSWNYVAFSFSYYFNYKFSAQYKFWAGWVDKENNPDLIKYKGYGLVAFNYQSGNERLWCSVIINPRKKVYNWNTTWEVNYKISSWANEYLFIQFYNGYAENLLEYDKYSSMIRFGICIKPSLRSFY